MCCAGTVVKVTAETSEDHSPPIVLLGSQLRTITSFPLRRLCYSFHINEDVIEHRSYGFILLADQGFISSWQRAMDISSVKFYNWIERWDITYVTEQQAGDRGIEKRALETHLGWMYRVDTKDSRCQDLNNPEHIILKCMPWADNKLKCGFL